MFGEFPHHIIPFVERISQRSAIFPLLIFQTVGSVSAQEPVFVKVGSSHTTQAEAGSVDVVARNHRVDRTDIHFTLMVFTTGFHEVLDQCFRTKDDIFESRDLFQTIDEYIHIAFLLGQRYLAHTRPIFVTLRKHIGFFDHRAFQAEQPLLYRVKLIIAVFSRSFYL